jgi:hypothetical protein
MKAVYGRGDGSFYRNFRAYIALDGHRLAAQSYHFTKGLSGFGLGIAEGDHYIRSGLCQGKCNRTAHTPRAAGDECRFAVKGLVSHGPA